MSELPWDDSRVSLVMQIFNARVSSVMPITNVVMSTNDHDQQYNIYVGGTQDG